MPRKVANTDVPARRTRPPITAEAREREMIALATDCAEEQLRNGTASSQMICYYLKLGSAKERIEREMLEEQKKLLVAKTESLEAAKKAEEDYEKVLAALRSYNGIDDEDTEIF
jgi:hypothetical protein